MNPPIPPSELQLAVVLRLRRAALHQAVDDQIDQLHLELGLQPPPVEPTIGMSFEPTVLFEYVPQESSQTQLGFYEIQPNRTVEVVCAPHDGKVFFETVNSAGVLSTRSLDNELFHQLFRPLAGPEQLQEVRYGVHPACPTVALRYNADGSVTRGRFAERGEFIADE